MITDWTELAKNVGSLNENGSEAGGDRYAIKAFDEILGDKWIVRTVEHIISFAKGSELAMNCLRYIRSEKAARYAYQIYKTSNNERKELAVWLIKHIGNPVSFDWIDEFLHDKSVALYGIGLLDQLLWTKQIPFDHKVEALLETAGKISEGQLNEMIKTIKKYNEDKDTSL